MQGDTLIGTEHFYTKIFAHNSKFKYNKLIPLC